MILSLSELTCGDGSYNEAEDMSDLNPMPALRCKARAKVLAEDRKKGKIFGPVGLLAKSMHHNAARIRFQNGVFEILQFGLWLIVIADYI